MSTRRSAVIAIAAYFAISLVGVVLRFPILSMPSILIAGYLFIRLGQSQSRERAAVRAAVFMGAVSGIVSMVFLTGNAVVTTLSPDDKPWYEGVSGDNSFSAFVSSLILSAIVNFALGVALGGVGGYLAERTRRTLPPPGPTGDSSGTFDLRDQWKQ
jgi:hypothetical protein